MKSIYHDPDLQEGKANRKWFENVKLIGQIDKGTSIYIEDYAYTYLHQCANRDLSYELCAVLIGEHDVELERMIIYGAIFVELEELSADSKWLDQGVLDAMGQTIKEYFPEGKCVGWMHTQPGYGIMATIQEMAVHKEIFNEDSVLMLIDPVSGREAFFICEDGEFQYKQGFCIYYEKNEQMLRYMEEYPMGDPKEQEVDDKVVGEFRKLGSKRKREIEKKRKRSKMISAVVAATLLTTAFIMGKYSQRSAIDDLKKEVVNIQDEYSGVRHKILERPVELVFTSSQLESDEEPEQEPEPEIEAEEADEPEHEEKSEVEVAVEPEPEIKPETTVEAKAKTKPKAKLESEYDIHVVKAGESLLRISYNYYQTVGKAKEIAKLNDITDYDTIYIGQELKLPE